MPAEHYDYVVIGNPVAHSRSPEIHQLFAQQTGQELTYGRLQADNFAMTADAFFAAGGLGANVTVPFKNDAAQWVDELDPSAGFAGVVNTIVRHDQTFRGHNTDGAGLVADLRRVLNRPLNGADILVLGAGGAVRGVLAPLAAEKPARITIANRTPARAAQLATELAAEYMHLEIVAREYSRLSAGFDLVINGTSAGLSGTVAGVAGSVLEGAFCYDMSYGEQTAFCQFARAAGAAAAIDGLGMLVEQAALAFALWRGTKPDADAVLQRLRAADASAHSDEG